MTSGVTPEDRRGSRAMHDPRVVPEGSPGAATQLQGSLGVASVFFAVVAWAAPLLVVVGLVPSMIGFAGQAIVACFAATTIILLLFAVGYTTITRHVEQPGAFYAYIVAGLGKPAGLGGAFVATFSYLILLLTTWVVFGVFSRQLIHDTFHGPSLPWWLMAAAAVVVVGVLSLFSVELSAKVLTFALALEVAVVVVFDARIFANGGPDGVTTTPFTWGAITHGSIGLGVLFAVLCFIGFESSALYREETKNPEVTIRRATYLAVIAIGVFYMVAAWAMVTGLGAAGVSAAQTADVTTMVSQLATTYVGKVLSDIIAVLMVSSTFACLLSLHNGVTRYAYSLGRDGVLPQRLGRAHPRHHSPYVASTVITVLSLIATLLIAAVTGFQASGSKAYTIYIRVNGLGTIGVLFLMCFVSVAVLAYFQRNEALRVGRAWSTRVAPGLGLVGLVAIFVLAAQNLNSLIGASTAVSAMLTAILPVVFVIGFCLAMRLRRSNVAVYQRIGRQ
jgi:amino acid transporter